MSRLPRLLRAVVSGLSRPGALLLAGLALLAVGPPAAAQSLLSTRGLGYPLAPVDARGRALGVTGVGLFQPSVSPVDPAAPADLAVPALALSLQTTWAEPAVEGANDPQGTRFPLIGLAYPVPAVGMATVTFSGVLDQRYRVEVPREIALGEGTTDVTDRFLSDGGVSAVRVGLARRINPNLSVGASVGRYVGEVTRTFTRTFDSLQVGTGAIPDFRAQGAWSYGGYLATAGARLRVGNAVQVGGSVTWSAELEAEPQEGTEGDADAFDMPMEVHLGASGRLTPDLGLVLGVDWADWGGTDAGEAEGRSTLGLGGGLEYGGLTLAGRPLPVRFGYRRSELPFETGEEAPVETAWSGGLGLTLVQSGELPLAAVQLALERGDRSGGGVDESFWRGTLSMRVAGF